MEFNNQYLTYEEYKSLGGTLGEMPFNILEFKCRKIIDNLTFNRLTNLKTQIQEVKMCIYDMINISSKYEQTSNKQAQGITSESIDGYSVSYGSINAEQEKARELELQGCARDYLIDCKLIDGTPYMYCGVC